MKFILISRHTNGSEVPESEREKNLQELGAWVSMLKPSMVMPIRGGAVVDASGRRPYDGDVGGAIVYEAEDLDHAVALASQSPGLKYGFTHEVLLEVPLEQAAGEPVSKA